MAKKSHVVKTLKKNQSIIRNAAKRLSLKDKASSGDIMSSIALSTLRYSSSSRKKNRCNVSGRPRGYVGFFGVSRVVLRELASLGDIPGLHKN